MFYPEGQVRVFLYGQPVNMRLSFQGLYALATAPCSGCAATS
jgi:transposase